MLLHNAQASDLLTYSYLNVSCVLDGSALPSDFEEDYLRTQNNFSGICQLYFFSLDDYNRMMDTDYTLNTYEMFLYKKGGRNYAYQELTLPGQTTYHLKAALKSFLMWKIPIPISAAPILSLSLILKPYAACCPKITLLFFGITASGHPFPQRNRIS